MKRSVKVEVIFDPGCPWCYIGKRRLEQALDLRRSIRVQLHWWPFLLNPDIPTDGIDRTTYLVRKFGSETRVSRVYGAIADVGQSVEIDFAFDRIRRTPNTINAHRLIRFAQGVNKATTAVEALFHNHFVRGLDIGETGSLVRIGSDIGLDPRSLAAYLHTDAEVSLVYAENARAHQLGINGVPSFVFNGEYVISGAHEPRVLARMLDIAREGVAA